MSVSNLRQNSTYEKAKCKVEKLCKFDLVLDAEDVLKERCRFCNKNLYWNKVDGKVDEMAYSRAHIRDILQPGMKAYDEIYGTSWKKRIDPEKEKMKSDDWQHAVKDTAKTLSKLDDRSRL